MNWRLPPFRHASIPATLVPWLLLASVGCAKGTGDPYADDEAIDYGGELPDEVDLSPNGDGAYGPDRTGFVGTWAGEAGPDSTLEVSFSRGDICLEGETAEVPDGEFGTYWGARVSFNLCQDESGNPRALDECLDSSRVDALAGFAMTLEGSLPWLVSIQFEEVDRDTPASIWLRKGGEVFALLSDATDPFDAQAPLIDPAKLQSVVIRAAGTTDGPQSFDFCIDEFRALFGDGWEDADLPEWVSAPGPGQQVDFVGVNLVGAEFGEQNLPGVYGDDYIYPNPGSIDYFAAKGMNVFRIPFRWERMQPELEGALDSTELGYLKDTISAAQDHDATVIVDPHNFARYEDDPSDDVAPGVIGVEVEIDAFADFWRRLAREFAGDDLVWFGLMNEPHDMETELWVDAANAALEAIRAEDADNLVLVPGNQWTGAHAWFADYYGTPNSDALKSIVDPGDNFVFELHQYFDADYSGTSSSCVSESVGVERVEQVTEGLYEEGFRGFLAEFGGSDDATCLGAMDQLLAHLGDNAEVWRGWTVWASTEWGLQHNIRPVNGNDSDQMRVLLRHLNGG